MISTCLWGQTGPERAYPGFGGQGSALAGFNYLTGWPDREPLGPFGTITDSISPRYGVVAIAAALLHRARTGRGAYIDVSQVETGVYGLTEWLLGYAASGADRSAASATARRTPRRTASSPAPARIAGSRIAVHDDADWQRLVRAMGSPAWATAAELATLDGRLRAVDALEQQLAEWTRAQDAEALAAHAAGRRPRRGARWRTCRTCSPIRSSPHRGHFHELTHPVVGRYVVEANGPALLRRADAVHPPGAAASPPTARSLPRPARPAAGGVRRALRRRRVGVTVAERWAGRRPGPRRDW